MEELEDIDIKVQLDEISNKIDAILQKINSVESTRSENAGETTDSQ
jgi:hypothetical protein